MDGRRAKGGEFESREINNAKKRRSRVREKNKRVGKRGREHVKEGEKRRQSGVRGKVRKMMRRI